MPQLIRNKTIIEDIWTVVADGDAVPSTPALVSAERWRAERETLRASAGSVGLALTPGEDVRGLGDLDGIELIAIAFPKFADGRGYSQAFLLRRELGYTGALRATGQILHDQLWQMSRCGFDEFAFADHQDAQYAIDRAFTTFRRAYQTSADDREPALFDPHPN